MSEPASKSDPSCESFRIRYRLRFLFGLTTFAIASILVVRWTGASSAPLVGGLWGTGLFYIIRRMGDPLGTASASRSIGVAASFAAVGFIAGRAVQAALEQNTVLAAIYVLFTVCGGVGLAIGARIYRRRGSNDRE